MGEPLNQYEETLIKNHRLPSEWQSQEALDGLLAFLQQNWEQRTSLFDDGQTTTSQQYLQFTGQKGINPTTSLLIWTTTPWTLPANLMVAAHPDMTYVKAVFSDGDNCDKIICMESQAEYVMKKGGFSSFTVLETARPVSVLASPVQNETS